MDDGFLRSVEAHRRELVAHCYRMTGSLAEAEDLVQETFLRAWQSRTSFAGRSSLRTWLYRIATNACIDVLRAKKRRTLPPLVDGVAPSPGADAMPAPVVDPVWLEPFAEDLLPDNAPGPEAIVGQRESVRAAFLVALQHLTPSQRAILLLRDVIGFSGEECASLLDLSAAAVASSLARAREEVAARGAGGSEHAPRAGAALLDDDKRALLTRYIAAWERRDLDGLALLLRRDSVLSMPPFPSWYRGPADICAVLGHAVLTRDVRIIPLALNGADLGFAGWHRVDDDGAWAPLGVQCVDLVRDDAGALVVASITCFVGAEHFARFGLPPTPPAM